MQQDIFAQTSLQPLKMVLSSLYIIRMLVLMPGNLGYGLNEIVDGVLDPRSGPGHY